MAVTILSLVLLLALCVLFVWLARRAWRARRAYLRWPGVLFAGLFALVLGAAAVLAAIGLGRASTAAANPVPDLQASAGAEQLAHGQRLAALCVQCHSSTGDLPLDGSKMDLVTEFGGPPLGTFYGPNLTPGGPLKDWTDGEIARVIREGVGKGGRPLLVMPSQGFYGMSDSDVRDLVAYLRSQPAVKRDLPPTSPNVLAAMLVGSGMFPTSVQPPINGPRTSPPPGPTADYGAYLVSISGCRDCHGKDLAGHVSSGPTDTPSAPNLRATAGQWTEADFRNTIRTGVTPQGQQLNATMPWKDVSRAFTDDDLAAVHAYIVSLK